MAKARQQYFADEVTLQKENRDFSIQPELVEKLEGIEAGAQVNVIETVKVNGEALIPDEDKAVDVSVPLVEDTLYSTDTDKALSANQGKVLYEYIQNLASRGRYLSNWNTVTGLPTTNPVDNPYQYRAGDYYIVSTVAALGGTNYKPNGSSYARNVASTTVETETVKVGDYYTYDGQTWLLLVNTAREIAVDSSLSTTSTNPVENRVVTQAINLKANDADISVVGKTNDFNDLDNIPQIPDSLDDLTGTSDDITEGSTHLFLTSAERTKLTNTTGINTGDETNASIMSKLGAASSTTNGYLTVADWNTFNNKQGAISDLETIRSNASAGKNASDTIATYGDVVTHDANEFATATQGGKADTALQPGDNVSELTNDAGYITDAYHDSTKQDKLIAGTNVQIASDGKTISATDTTYVAGDFDIKDLADSTGLRTEWSGKQDELIAGSNIQIAADGKTISATDTTYSAGAGISISNNNVISAIDNKASWGSIEGTLSNQTDLQSALDDKQDTLTAGANIQIAQDGTISATDTTYTAGTGIDITNGVISNTQTSAEWGNISGTLSDQTDLQSALDAKQDDMVILKYGVSTWNDFITAYQKNGVVYCRASSQSNPATGTQGRLAFMAYVNNADNPTEVEFQYYRSRSNHDSAANQLDEVYVYKLVPASGGTWTVTQRNTAAKATAGTGINLTYGSGNMTIANTGVTSINSQTGAVTLNIPTVPTNVSDFVNDAGYITANDLPTVDTSMSDSSTNTVQNKVIKSYVDTQVSEVTAGAVSDTAYSSAWDGITGIAPSKNAVYDKISAMDTTIAGKQNTISDLATIRTGAGKGATAVQPGDNVSTLTNDAGFITKAVSDLTNYYTKSETYTKSEVADYVANFAGFKVVATLPTTDIKTTIIYLLGPVGSGADKYEEYIYSNNTWVKIGETSVDLTNYFNTSTDNSDSITQGSTNLFLTSAERTKLNNTSGTNTGDETKATIQSKLGAASSSASGYLTSTDWNTFNEKANTTIISDTAYGSGWDADTTHAPTKNAVYDKISSIDTTISGKQDTLVSGTNIKSINNNSLLGSGNLTLNDVKVSATAPSSPTEGMVWYDTTNDQLKVYDWTNWNVTGKEYNAGPGISIGQYQDYSAMQGPAPDGFHVGTLPEWEAINNDGQTMGAWNAQHNNMSVYLKMPGCGMLNSSTGSKYGTYKYYWTSSVLTGDYAAYSSYIDVSAGYNLDGTGGRGTGYPIRPIKDKPVIPDNSWTVIYQGTGSAGIFHNATLGLISLSKDGTTRYTLADKNLGATTVWNNGDTVSQDNGGNFYQRGNNYGFPFTGATTTSSTKVDASTYGPGNYYNSSTFIKSSSWDSSNNTNLRGVVTGVVTLENAITNTGVLSVNGQTGDVTGLQTTSNLKTSLTDNSDSYYPSQKAVKTAVDGKQDTLVSGTNIKSINNNSLLGSGNINVGDVTGPSSSTDGYVTVFDGTTGKAIKDSNINSANLVLTYGSQSISGTKIFVNEPVLPGKTADATNTGTAPATEAQVYKKQDTLVSGTNIKTINNTSLLGSGNIDIQSGGNYTAGEGIEIKNGPDYSAMQGPCKTGFHVPLISEWESVKTIWNTLSGGNVGGDFSKYLKIPFPGMRVFNSGDSSSQGTSGFYWSSTGNSGNASYLYIGSSSISSSARNKAYGYAVRAFKDSAIIPTSSWNKLYGTSIEAGGIFHNPTDGIISLSSNGLDWITISDKNEGATTVWNTGDTLSESNAGKYYQRGNNYGFPFTGSVTTSSAQVDARNYGPGNYYNSGTFIMPPDSSANDGDWSSYTNNNLWGATTGVVILNNAISNTGVLSVNGQTGNVTIQSGGIQNDTTGTTSTVTGIWAGSEAEYTNLGTKSGTVLYFTF